MSLPTIRSFTKILTCNSFHWTSNTRTFLKTEQLTSISRGVLCLNYVFSLESFVKPSPGCYNNVCLDPKTFALKFPGYLACILSLSISSVIAKETEVSTILDTCLKGQWRMKIGGKTLALLFCSDFILAPSVAVRSQKPETMHTRLSKHSYKPKSTCSKGSAIGDGLSHLSASSEIRYFCFFSWLHFTATSLGDKYAGMRYYSKILSHFSHQETICSFNYALNKALILKHSLW